MRKIYVFALIAFLLVTGSTITGCSLADKVAQYQNAVEEWGNLWQAVLLQAGMSKDSPTSLTAVFLPRMEKYKKDFEALAAPEPLANPRETIISGIKYTIAATKQYIESKVDTGDNLWDSGRAVFQVGYDAIMDY